MASGGHPPFKTRRDNVKELGVGLAKRAGWRVARCGEDAGFEGTFKILARVYSEVIVFRVLLPPE